MKPLFVSLALVLAWSCGGKAVVDPGGDTTSSSGTGGTTSSSSSTSSGTGGATTTTNTPITDCEWACTELFICGLETAPNDGQLCEGFEPEDIDLFLYGSASMACVPTCENMPALAALVDPEDCESTVKIMSSASPDFLCVCEFGPGSPECN